MLSESAKKQIMLAEAISPYGDCLEFYMHHGNAPYKIHMRGLHRYFNLSEYSSTFIVWETEPDSHWRYISTMEDVFDFWDTLLMCLYMEE